MGPRNTLPAQKENSSDTTPSSPQMSQKRSKTSTFRYFCPKKRINKHIQNEDFPIYSVLSRYPRPFRIISNDHEIHTITANEQVHKKNEQRPSPSQRSVESHIAVEDVYQPPVHSECSNSYGRETEKKNSNEDEQVVACDPPTTVNPSVHDTSINDELPDSEFCRQRQAAIDNKKYRKIILSWKVTSLDQLVHLIKKLSRDKNSIDLAWIVFFWVTQNIEYDVGAYFSGNIKRQSVDDILHDKKGVCDAYGTIFKAICDGVSLPCRKISGYAKGYSFVSDKSSFTRANHAWNVIKLNDRWHLIDSTWGAGHLNNNNQLQKDLNTYYFLTPPQHMIYSHLPEDFQWQLLSCPISMEQFLKLPQLRSGFFDLQLELVSTRKTNMVTFDPHRAVAEVLIRAPADVYLKCLIAHDETSGLAQYDSDRNLWQCLFRPHSSGYKTLNVFARRGRSSESYKAVLESQLNMIDMVRFDKFPVTYGKFTERKCQIFGPLIEKLKQGSQVTIRCRIPGVRCVCLGFDGTLTLEKYNLVNDIFEEQIIVPNRDVVVYVQFADDIKSSSYTALFKYTVE